MRAYPSANKTPAAHAECWVQPGPEAEALGLTGLCGQRNRCRGTLAQQVVLLQVVAQLIVGKAERSRGAALIVLVCRQGLGEQALFIGTHAPEEVSAQSGL